MNRFRRGNCFSLPCFHVCRDSFRYFRMNFPDSTWIPGVTRGIWGVILTAFFHWAGSRLGVTPPFFHFLPRRERPGWIHDWTSIFLKEMAEIFSKLDPEIDEYTPSSGRSGLISFRIPFLHLFEFLLLRGTIPKIQKHLFWKEGDFFSTWCVSVFFLYFRKDFRNLFRVVF